MRLFYTVETCFQFPKILMNSSSIAGAIKNRESSKIGKNGENVGGGNSICSFQQQSMQQLK